MQHSPEALDEGHNSSPAHHCVTQEGIKQMREKSAQKRKRRAEQVQASLRKCDRVEDMA